MQAVYHVGQHVVVNIGGCVENRTEGVITSIKNRPELVTYEVDFPAYGSTDTRIERFYMAQDLIPVG
jgi:hypothetical protein